jgi:hypothetical protein
MRYTRSSYITWLTKSCHCEVYPLKNNPKVLVIKYLNETSKMFVNHNDVIDYEEIFLHYQRLLLPYLPGDKDLTKLD